MYNQDNIGDNIPQQKRGGESNIHESRQLPSSERSKEVFRQAAENLLSVDRWKKLSGNASAEFRLTDSGGNELHRKTEKGDRIRIDIPGPGTQTGKGFDWVKVEGIERIHDEKNDTESLLMQVRPAPDPQTSSDTTAHFFKDNATSNFLVQRQGKTVTATILGRNEIPNTETGNLTDDARNFIVASSAKAGFSFIQWKKLAKGLIGND